HPRGARALPAVSRGRAAAAHRDQSGDRAGPDRARRVAESGGVLGKASASATPAVCARGDGAIARRDHAGVVLSSQPAEHEHREAHAGDVVCRVRGGAPVTYNVASYRLLTVISFQPIRNTPSQRWHRMLSGRPLIGERWRQTGQAAYRSPHSGGGTTPPPRRDRT